MTATLGAVTAGGQKFEWYLPPAATAPLTVRFDSWNTTTPVTAPPPGDPGDGTTETVVVDGATVHFTNLEG